MHLPPPAISNGGTSERVPIPSFSFGISIPRRLFPKVQMQTVSYPKGNNLFKYAENRDLCARATYFVAEWTEGLISSIVVSINTMRILLIHDTRSVSLLSAVVLHRVLS